MTSGYMPEAVQMYRCPICGNLFESHRQCMDHGESCEIERRRYLDSLVGSILIKSGDDCLNIFIPREVPEDVHGTVMGDMVGFAYADGQLTVLTDREWMSFADLKDYISVDSEIAESKTREWLDMSKDIIFDLYSDVKGGGLR